MPFSWIKLCAFVGVIVFVLAIVGGGYLLFQHQQNIIAEQKATNDKLDSAVAEQKATIESIRNDIEQQKVVRAELEKQVVSARKDMDSLEQRLHKHDLTQIAQKKATLLEKKINRASLEMGRCFEIATGAQVEHDEKNTQCSDLVNSAAAP